MTSQRREAGRYAALARQTFDLLIIGGGIIGCGIARDAVLRGLRVALFEKDDFGGGTSSRSTRLIHGGLRYLEQLDFGLVRQDLRERERLLATAPHRVVPLRFLVPLYRRSLLYRARLRVGMILYDLLSYDKSLPGHRFLGRDETLREEPGLAADDLQGAATYYDAQCAFVERLCLDNLTDAAENGAQVYNDTRVTGLLRDGNRVRGLTLCDTRTGETAEVHAPQVVNASGPWLDALTGDLTGQASRRLRLTKGVHFAAPPASHNALVLFSATDGRLFFVIPWLDGSWVGTTDTDYTGDPDAVRATGEDVRYLREGVESVLPCADWDRIYYTAAGLRALVRPTRANARESEVSRKHRLLVHTAGEGWEGLFSVLGGKITAYRDIAEETVNALVRQHNARAIETQSLKSEAQNPKSKIQNGASTLPLRPCVTAIRPLPGGDFTDREALRSEIRREAATLNLSAAQADNLTTLYGTRAGRLLEMAGARPELRAPIAPPYPDIVAEIVYAVEQEWARTVSDFLLRRSLLGFTPDQGRAALPAVATEMGCLLDWSPERVIEECDAYRAHVALTQAFRQD